MAGGDIAAWLGALGLEKYAALFAEQEIDLAVLPELSDADLAALGLPLGPRRKLLKAAAALVDAAPEPPPTPASVPASRDAERRQLTVLFCDLVGSTQLSQRLDPEDLRELTRRYQDGVAGVIVRYGGYVANFQGDGIVAYFGWPRADEDQADLAVRAGLAALGVVRGLADGRSDDVRVSARVGIASGAVVVGDLEGGGARQATVSGETPNLAARLQAEAQPDQVVLGGLTRQLIGDAFELESLGARHLKGFAEPVPAWRVVRERPIESRFAARGGGHSRLVGRTQEVALLMERWQQGVAGEGQAVLLSGEAGIGKSRIVQALREQLAEEPYTFLGFQCSPFHAASALYPVIRHLERAAAFTPEDPPEARLDKLETLLREATDDIAESAPLLAGLLLIPTSDRYSLLDMPGDLRKQRTLKALADQLFGLAAEKPVLFVLEDAHWIDPTTRELIDELLIRVAGARVLVVVTHRPEFTSDWTRHPHVTVLTLNRLSRAQAAEVVRAAGAGVLPEDVVARILRRSDGVPLFIEELTRSVLESGGSGGETTVPETLQAALQARLDRLDSEARELAQVSAVIGREFDVALLAAVVRRPPGELARDLDRLIEPQIVLPAGARQAGTYVFRHALIQDAAYNSLLVSRRRGYHREIAAAMEAGFPDIVQAQPELVAQHYTAAGLVSQALPYWLSAGKHAADRWANLEAIGHLERGLQLVGELAPDADRARLELGLHLTLGGALVGASRLELAKEAYARAVGLAKSAGSAADLADAAIGFNIAEIYLSIPQHASVSILRDALAALGEGQGVERSRVLGRLGRAIYSTGDADQARGIIRESIDIARRTGDPGSLFEALQSTLPTTAGHSWSAAEIPDRRALLDEVLQAAERSGQSHAKLQAYSFRSMFLLELGHISDFDESLRLYEALSEAYSFPANMWVARACRAVQSILRGEFATAESEAELALGIGTPVNPEIATGVYGVQMFTIRREQGRLADVAPLFKRFVDDGAGDAMWRPGLALIACDLGFEAAARKTLDALGTGGFAVPIDAKRTLTLSYLAEVCARLGDVDNAERVYGLLAPYRDMAVVAPIATVCIGAAARYLGMLAGTMRDWRLAEQHFETALVMDEQLQAWPWLAHTRYEYAQILFERGRTEDTLRAGELLATASASAERFGMVALRQKIDKCRQLR